MTAPTMPTPAPATAGAGPAGAPAISVTVHGLPAPQGSKRHVGHGRMVESSKAVAPWRQDVKYAALDAVAATADWSALDGPLVASMVFTFARRKGHFGTGRNAHLLRATAPVRPAVYPDLSKLVRSTEDALTGVVWADDARVVEYTRLAKHYAGDGGDDVLDVPGAVIRVWRLGEVADR